MIVLRTLRIQPVEGPKNSQSGFTLVELMAMIAIIGLLATIAIPGFVRARQASQTSACINNLRIIEAAKQQWASETAQQNKTPSITFDLVSCLDRNGSAMPNCPLGGAGYNIGALSAVPVCINYNASSHNAFISWKDNKTYAFK
jgi:prepilin-type N-terminal cleavage/methylation domain-containing protein